MTTNGAVPTAAQEDRFWTLLEAAWAPAGAEMNRARLSLAARPPGDGADAEHFSEALSGVLERLTEGCVALSSEELTELDLVVERKLYDIDRQAVHAVTDGSDDGFLYARGFIVAMGREFYEAVVADPRVAVLDAECEELCYLYARMHDKQFGAWPKSASGISRESFSNPAGWAA